MSPPSPNGGNGRDGRGRFAKGNVGGTGNPHARHVGQLRSALLATVTSEDIEAVVGKLIELAKNGNIQAAKEVLDRIYGRPNQPIEGMLAVPHLTLTPEQRARAARIAARCDAILEDE